MLSLLFFTAALAAPAVNNTSSSVCGAGSSIGTYTIRANDTIYSIATTLNRGVCPLARYNHLSDPELLYPGEVLYIPPEACNTNAADTSCLLSLQNSTTNDCIFGGPHTYRTFEGDTLRKIALGKFNITLEALESSVGRMAGVSSPDETIEPNTFIKLPQCNPSSCGIKPLEYVWGTYKDLAEEYGTTPGQIFALNPTFNHSSTGPGVGGWITLPVNCGLEGETYTVVS
ncbi:hypothetical protein BDV33DRAFT_206279 [Aspergillus novoparasiticus]|uniref:LysM domain-containing protein n=1 Tax=Aspergillus novoparasiticus TaxID=986946 RepID=A0A5N6EIU3_9EURO|nr:hypothetical protein BDV33DRAFT_206279 [Aspergillus novoparasiticus]